MLPKGKLISKILLDDDTNSRRLKKEGKDLIESKCRNFSYQSFVLNNLEKEILEHEHLKGLIGKNGFLAFLAGINV